MLIKPSSNPLSFFPVKDLCSSVHITLILLSPLLSCEKTKLGLDNVKIPILRLGKKQPNIMRIWRWLGHHQPPAPPFVPEHCACLPLSHHQPAHRRSLPAATAHDIKDPHFYLLRFKKLVQHMCEPHRDSQHLDIDRVMLLSHITKRANVYDHNSIYQPTRSHQAEPKRWAIDSTDLTLSSQVHFTQEKEANLLQGPWLAQRRTGICIQCPDSRLNGILSLVCNTLLINSYYSGRRVTPIISRECN